MVVMMMMMMVEPLLERPKKKLTPFPCSIDDTQRAAERSRQPLGVAATVHLCRYSTVLLAWTASASN